MTTEAHFNKQKRLRRELVRTAGLTALESTFTEDKVKPEIVDLPHEELIAKLQSRELKAVDVLSAYVWKSLQVTRRCNCVTEYHPRMMDWAEELDDMPDVKGPFHGVPFCVKDDTDLVGMDTTVGCSALLDHPAERSAVVVQVLIDAGAIPFCKTNVPQAICSYDSENPIYGKTLNPWDTRMTPGGSSSGTAALVAAGGAVFGTGSDIGGSLRCPSHMCGTSTLLPTQFRNSVRGLKQVANNESGGLHGQIGVITRHANLLAQIYQYLWENNIQTAYDHSLVPLDWNSQLFNSIHRYRIGYFTSDPLFPPIGDTPHVVLQAKEHLESLGHTLVPFHVPDIPKAIEIFQTLIFGDSGKHSRRLLQHDEVLIPAQKFFQVEAYGSLNRSKRDVHINPRAGETEVNWDYLKMQRDYKNHLLDLMKGSEIDALLTPAFPFPACPAGDVETEFGINVGTYTFPWNMVGFPAGVLPFGIESGQWISHYDDECDPVLSKAKESLRSCLGMPIGIQLIAKPYKDEIVLSLMCELAPMSAYKIPPKTPHPKFS